MQKVPPKTRRHALPERVNRNIVVFVVAGVCSLILVLVGASHGIQSLLPEEDAAPYSDFTGTEPVLAGFPPLPEDNLVREHRAATSLLPPLMTGIELASLDDGAAPTIVEEPLYSAPEVPQPNSGQPEPAPARSPSLTPDPSEQPNLPSGLSPRDVWFVGDSIAVGFHDAVSAGADYLTGYIGAGSSDVARAFHDEVVSGERGPKPVVIVALGTNDSLGSEDTFAQNVDSILNAADKIGACVAWLTVHRISGSGSWASFNDTLTEIRKRDKRLRIIDWAKMANDNPSLLWNDGIHIRPEGYKALWDMASKATKGCLSQPNS
jgi:hypothetical protein